MKIGTKKTNKETPTVNPRQALARADVVSFYPPTSGDAPPTSGDKAPDNGRRYSPTLGDKAPDNERHSPRLRETQEKKRLAKPLGIKALSDAGKHLLFKTI